MTIASTLLAPDPRLPMRDLLLDPGEAGRRLAPRLGAGGPLELRGCELVRAKYRVGESLRVVYRLHLDGAGDQVRVVAARMFREGASAGVYQRALSTAVPSPPLRPVARDAELDSVYWSFPNDRRLTNLPALAAVPEPSRGVLGRPWASSRLAAYAPEKSATARCLDEAGATLAYVKLYSLPEAGRHWRVLQAVARHGRLGGGVRVPAVLACSDDRRMLWLEAIGGSPLGELHGEALDQGMAALGTALARLHRMPAGGLPSFARLDLSRLHGSARVVGLARPELAAAAARLATTLADTWRRPAGEPVHLHGDVHHRNALVDRGRLTLIDLDQAGAGWPAADLGSALARLIGDRLLGTLDAGRAAELALILLGAYADSAPLPEPASLRWHTAAALLAERALRAVNRVVVDTLPILGGLLAAGSALLAPVGEELAEVPR